jgi:uncharacterized protein YecE (DUF72 family)
VALDAAALSNGFQEIRNIHDGQIVVEVRHKSWASAEALDLLESYAIDRVLADPSPVWPVESFDTPPRYIRLHGKPKIYYSSYSENEVQFYSESWRQMVSAY